MKKALPHICIVMSLIFITLWIIDRFNRAMGFLSSDVFKFPFFIFLLLVIAQSVILVGYQRGNRR